MTQHSPHKIITVDCGVEECLKRLTVASNAAPYPLFAIFGHHRPDSGFTYQNARDWFVIQDPPKNLENEIFPSPLANEVRPSPVPRPLSTRIFFEPRLFAQEYDRSKFFENLASLTQPYLLICPFVLAHETSSSEPFLALGWGFEIRLEAKNANDENCTLNLISETDVHLAVFHHWLTQALANKDLSPVKKAVLRNKKKSQLSLDRNAFVAAVEGAQKKMRQGDAYLINLAVQATGLKVEDEFLPEMFCETLAIEQLRYFVFFRFEQFAILSYSPERFIKIENGNILTEPIKGTRPINPVTAKMGTRPINPIIDATVATMVTVPIATIHTLWDREKEMNEQCLVVDLLRNDLNLVCKAGSVGVARPFTIHHVGGLLQMQSYVFGKLKDPTNLGTVLCQLLPAGSISGTPKIECCQLISNLEPVQRGFFTGIFGICDFENNQLSFESCILIRSHFMGNLGIYAGAGCGLTTLSEPEAEFDEIQQKIASFSRMGQ